MSLRFFNTLSGQKEDFSPIRPGQVTLYVCGVTVYDHCHIGHARGAVVFDVLRRHLESPRHGFKVIHVRNITDVDDKIIDRARQWGQTLRGLTPSGLPDLRGRVTQVAQHYTESFQRDFARLGLLRPTHEPRATEYIPKMVDFIQGLVQKGVAYEGSGGLYFSVREFAKRNVYGQLSHQDPDQMREGVRKEPGEGKRDPLDFALWKKARPEEPSWDSPWGPGRPGWHIECSTMSTALLGDTFDIHGGGQDLIFPHHENELAQSVGAGKKFARYWLHNGLLTVNGQKMSKSLGNIVQISGENGILDHSSADVLKLFFLSAHYRSPLDLNWEILERQTTHAYERLSDFVHEVEMLPENGEVEQSYFEKEAREKLFDAMDDDLNTPKALGALYKLVDQTTAWLEEAKREGLFVAKPETLSPSLQQHCRWLKSAGRSVREFGEKTLGFSFPLSALEQQLGGVQVEVLKKERDEARRRQDYPKADQIRRQLVDMGYIVEDTAAGTLVRKRA